MFCIKRGRGNGWRHAPNPYLLLEGLGRIFDLTLFGNTCSDPGISYPIDRTSAFHCTKDGIRQVLAHHRSRSEISIVGNVDQNVRAVISELARDARIRRLNTDKNS